MSLDTERLYSSCSASPVGEVTTISLARRVSYYPLTQRRAQIVRDLPAILATKTTPG